MRAPSSSDKVSGATAKAGSASDQAVEVAFARTEILILIFLRKWTAFLFPVDLSGLSSDLELRFPLTFRREAKRLKISEPPLVRKVNSSIFLDVQAPEGWLVRSVKQVLVADLQSRKSLGSTIRLDVPMSADMALTVRVSSGTNCQSSSLTAGAKVFPGRGVDCAERLMLPMGSATPELDTAAALGDGAVSTFITISSRRETT